MENREAFKYFIENCTTISKSADKYVGALKKVSESLQSIKGTGVSEVWDIERFEEGSRIQDLLYKDPEFIEYNYNRGHNMYSGAYEWYLKFLQAKKLFSSNVRDIRIDVRNIEITQSNYLRAMRTKPFLLLAGISGTGKSRIVKEMAFDSCPTEDVTGNWNLPSLRLDSTSPGNYCLVEVKPNWHDSSELLGYESRIGKANYVVTPFIRFLVKAMLYEEQKIPFFVCLDEMNLAPVEQYFAEFLSVLESRKIVDGKITSEVLIPASIFKTYDVDLAAELFSIKKKPTTYPGVSANMTAITLDSNQQKVFDILKEHGLRIPSNIIVIGTVNMDETTHQFSRKVIDRAMTIEMNLPDGDPFMDFYNSRELSYRESPLDASYYLPTKVSAKEALEELVENNAEKTEWLKGEVAKVLTGINTALEDTPFKIAYRVQNELVIYFYEVWRENKDAKWREILTDTVDKILMMKVLPRIEGDEDLLEKPLERLADFCVPYTKATKKIQEMKTRLDRAHFTSYWP